MNYLLRLVENFKNILDQVELIEILPTKKHILG